MMAEDIGPLRQQAVYQAKQIAGMCDFFENPHIKQTIERIVPVSVTRDIGAFFDPELFAGFGIVGLWAALDAFAERGGLSGKCDTCGKNCIVGQFAKYAHDDAEALRELEDLRHLYAHNFGGKADEGYFRPKFKRHVLHRDRSARLTCGADFNGSRVALTVGHLRMYAEAVQRILERVT